jgi:hypothetical protein
MEPTNAAPPRGGTEGVGVGAPAEGVAAGETEGDAPAESDAVGVGAPLRVAERVTEGVAPADIEAVRVSAPQGEAEGVGEGLPLVVGDTEGEAPADSEAVGVCVLEGVGVGEGVPVGELVGVGGGLAVGVALPDAELVLVAEGDAPTDSAAVGDAVRVEEAERVVEAVPVPVAVGVGVGVTVGDGLGDGGHVATMLGDQGVRAPERVPLQLLGDGFDTTSNFSAAKADVMGQLRLHLLNPNHPTPPLRNPDFVHLFSGQGGEKVDNMANSKAGLAFEASLQRLWALKNGNGTWADPVRIRVENEYPGAKAHLHVVQACLFGDGLAVGEGLHVGFFQMRLKLCTVHPELAFLTSSYLMAGLAETTSMSDRASDATKMNLHDLHAETWAKLGWDHFFDDKYVVLSHGEVAHMGFASLPGELHVFKLALLGLLLDNGEVRNVARTHNCLICNALNTEKDLGAGLPLAVQVPAAVLCARCSSLHAPPARRRRRRRWRRRRRRRRWWRWWRRRQRQGRQQWRRCGRRPAAAFATGRGCAHRYERRPRIGRRPGVCGPACHFCQGRVPQHHNVGSPVACRAACRGRGRGRGREHAPALNSRVAQNGFSKRELGKDAGGRRRYH